MKETESVRFNQRFKRALIIFAVVEFFVITLVVLYVVRES